MQGHRLRVIAPKGTTYYANETDVFVLAEKKRRLKVVAQRTELWRDEGIGDVFWYPTFAAVLSGSTKGGGNALRRLELRGNGFLGEDRLQTFGSISGPATSVGPDRIIVMGSEVARAVESTPAARGPYPYLQASVVALRQSEPREGEKPRPPGWVDKVNLPADVSGARESPTFLPGLGIAVIVAEGTRSCSAGPDCFRGFAQPYPTVVGLRVDPDGMLAMAGRLDEPGTVQRVLEHDGKVVLLTDEAVLLAGPDLRVRARIPRAG